MHGPDPPQSPATRAPPGLDRREGGSWLEGLVSARAAARQARMGDEIDINLGLRVLRELS